MLRISCGLAPGAECYIEAVQLPAGEQVPLIVDRSTPVIGFVPFPYADLTRVPNWTFIERVCNRLGIYCTPADGKDKIASRGFRRMRG